MTCEYMKLIKAFKKDSREEIVQRLQVMERVQKIRVGGKRKELKVEMCVAS